MTAADDPVLTALRPWLLPAGARAVLLAVSGGPDSTALMQAAAVLGANVPVLVATVDHGLRPGAADEAESVGRAAAALGFSHTVLKWAGDKPVTGLQEAARKARYRLLEEHAATIGADLLLTAHTRDDQAETVLMRLAAGSALAGLAGMRRERALSPRLRLGRPFLGLDKIRLVEWCRARGIAFVQDPSNRDVRFARARLRAASDVLADAGLTNTRLARLAERAARDEDALAVAAQEALRAVTLFEDAGSWGLDGPRLTALPDAIALRVMDHAIRRAGSDAFRLERLERLVFEVVLPAVRKGIPVRRTLAGLAISHRASGVVTLAPAPPRKNAGPAAPATGLLGNDDPPAYIGGA